MFKQEKGFTLIELLIVISIALLLFGSILVDFKGGEDSLSLQRSADALAQNIRKASTMAMSGQEFGVPSKIQKGGYGIYLDTDEANNKGYVLYGNENADETAYTTSPQSNHIDDIDLEKGVKIKEMKLDGTVTDYASINFQAPDPIVSISNNKNLAIITLCLEQECDTKIATIKVYKTGAVEVE